MKHLQSPHYSRSLKLLAPYPHLKTAPNIKINQHSPELSPKKAIERDLQSLKKEKKRFEAELDRLMRQHQKSINPEQGKVKIKFLKHIPRYSHNEQYRERIKTMVSEHKQKTEHKAEKERIRSNQVSPRRKHRVESGPSAIQFTYKTESNESTIYDIIKHYRAGKLELTDLHLDVNKLKEQREKQLEKLQKSGKKI